MQSPRRQAHTAWTIGLIALIAHAGIGAACGGSSSSSTGSAPTAPSNPSGATPTCRVYPTNATVTTTAPGVTQNAMLTGLFTTGTNQATITIRFVGGALCSTAVHSYGSTADFVDEVRVIPPVSLVRTTTTTNSGPCGSATATVTSTYDAQRRLTALSGPTGTTTYTAWDASGRPTAGAFPGSSITNAYNDATRTTTQTQTSGAGTTVTTMTYDANGAQTMVVTTTGGVVSTTTFANTSTATVCK